jgi:hypothetical protein
MPLTYYSTAPAFKAALQTALTARTGLSGVTISYGAPTQGPRESITLGDISGSQEFAALGALRKDETYVLDVYCSVLREGNQQQTCTERCFAIAAEIEDELRTNVTMTGTVRVAEVQSPFQLEEYASDQARQSVLTLGIQATERI